MTNCKHEQKCNNQGGCYGDCEMIYSDEEIEKIILLGEVSWSQVLSAVAYLKQCYNNSEAENQRLMKVLEDLVKHGEVVMGDSDIMPTFMFIAKQALAKEKDRG